MLPVRMNYVGAYNFFRDKTLSFLFKHMGVISKYQYTKDIMSIKKMKYCMDNNRVVALFPHGCLSNDGKPGGYAVFGVSKLVKFLDVPVVSARTNGGYLTRPRWSKRSRHGAMETKVSLALTLDEVRQFTPRQIYDRLIERISYDDYRWQREKMIPFKAKRPAEGVEFVLYKCPKCKSEFTMYSDNDILSCSKCKNTVVMNKYLMFEPEDSETEFFDGIDRWFDFQRECLMSETEDPEFEMTAMTELRYNEPGYYGYQFQGRGLLRITREAITYSGTVKDKKTELIYLMKNITMVPYAAGEYIEIADGDHISRFIFDDKIRMMKWVLAVRLIRDRYYEEIKHYEETK
ncbi:MAG: hypothetical protein JW903_00800 [Clostridia bacterium]|nr:hypothetical protein [Clostridia bacterium]